MRRLPEYRAGNPAPWAWAPAALGSSLLAWWDANATSTITAPGNAVSSWVDAVQGTAAVQATGAAQPVYSPTSFSGRPGITFDGTDDYLRSTSAPGIPTGSAGSEMWFLADQQATGADTASRDFASISSGGVSNNDARRANGIGSAGTFRVRGTTGTGAASVTYISFAADGFGRHVFRYVVTPTETWFEVDGVFDPASAAVPNTAATRLTIGATNANTAALFGKMTLAAMLITGPLSAGQAAQMYAYLTRRL